MWKNEFMPEPEPEPVWINEYEPREWVAVYELPWASEEDHQEIRVLCARLEKPEFSIMCAEGPMARDYWEYNQTTKGVFFWDFEQIAIECAGFNLDLASIKAAWGPSEIGVLQEEWREHPAGSLVYSFFRGVRYEPKFLTVAVAAPCDDEPVGNIIGLNKAAVLAALFNVAAPRGMGFLRHESNKPMTEEEAVGHLFEGDDIHRELGDFVREVGGRNRFRFDYLKGRPLKVDLHGNHVDTVFYNRENGAGTAERALEWLRKTGSVIPPEDLSYEQQERLINAGFEVLDHVESELIRFRLLGETFSLDFEDRVDALREAIIRAVKELPS